MTDKEALYWTGQNDLTLFEKYSGPWFLTNSSLYRTKSLGFFVFDYENSHIKPQFNERHFQRISYHNEQKHWFVLKFYHGFSEKYHIFEHRTLFATFESLKSVEFGIHVIFRNSNLKHFHSDPSLRFKLHCSYNVVQVTFSIPFEKTLQSKK